jgi:hypothetical protein
MSRVTACAIPEPEPEFEGAIPSSPVAIIPVYYCHEQKKRALRPASRLQTEMFRLYYISSLGNIRNYEKTSVKSAIRSKATAIEVWLQTSKRVKASAEHREMSGAGNGSRTRDTKLGKLVLYQLSYARQRHSRT